MRIEKADIYYVVLPLIYPYRTAYGEDASIHSVLVRLQSQGHSGWGEATPLYAPTYSPETAHSAFFLLSEFFAPALVGQEVQNPADLHQRLSHFKGNPLAKAAIESAWWTLESSRTETPLYRLLGGKLRAVEAGESLGVQASYDVLLEKIQAALDRGLKRIKLKAMHGWDLEMLRVVRRTYPDLVLHIDCNSGYTLEDLALFQAMDELGLAMIEQPLHHTDLYDHAELQRQIATPVCLDESVKSIRDLALALRLGSCRMLNIKYGRTGGLSVAKGLHDRAQAAGIPCWVGGMLESAVGTGLNVALATLPNFIYPGDLFESRRFYTRDLSEPAHEMQSDGTFMPVNRPGTPYPPLPERLQAATKHKASVSSTD